MRTRFSLLFRGHQRLWTRSLLLSGEWEVPDHTHHLCNFDSLCSRQFPAWKFVLHLPLPSPLPSSFPPSPLSSSMLMEQTRASACAQQHSAQYSQSPGTGWSHPRLSPALAPAAEPLLPEHFGNCPGSVLPQDGALVPLLRYSSSRSSRPSPSHLSRFP